MESKLTIVYYVFLAFSSVKSWELEPTIDCWEECFYEGGYQYQEAYKQFYDLGRVV